MRGARKMRVGRASGLTVDAGCGVPQKLLSEQLPRRAPHDQPEGETRGWARRRAESRTAQTARGFRKIRAFSKGGDIPAGHRPDPRENAGDSDAGDVVDDEAVVVELVEVHDGR